MVLNHSHMFFCDLVVFLDTRAILVYDIVDSALVYTYSFSIAAFLLAVIMSVAVSVAFIACTIAAAFAILAEV